VIRSESADKPIHRLITIGLCEASYSRDVFEAERRGGENGGTPWTLNRKYCPVKEREFY
jgi:hypothetical protein